MLEGSVSAVGRATVVALVATDCRTGATIAAAARSKSNARKTCSGAGPADRRDARARSVSRAHPCQSQRADRGCHHAVARSVEGVYRSGGASRRRRRDGRDSAARTRDRRSTRSSRSPTPRLSSVYGGLGETGRSEEVRQARLRAPRSRQRARAPLHHVSVPRPVHGRPAEDAGGARSMEAHLSRRLPAGERARRAAQPAWRLRGRRCSKRRRPARRNPVHAFPYSNLAYARRGAGSLRRSASSGRTGDLAEPRDRTDAAAPLPACRNRGDEAAARRHIEWASTRSRGFDITGARARWRHSADGSPRRASSTPRPLQRPNARGSRQVATGYEAQAAITEALYGYKHDAIERARHWCRLRPRTSRS